jgi:chromosome segregation ATPase
MMSAGCTEADLLRPEVAKLEQEVEALKAEKLETLKEAVVIREQIEFKAAELLALQTDYADIQRRLTDLHEKHAELELDNLGLSNKLETSEQRRTSLTLEIQRAGSVVQLARQIRVDQEKLAAQGEGANLQLYCSDCLKSAGDENDHKTGYLEECPQCGGKGPFMYSWDIAGVRAPQ